MPTTAFPFDERMQAFLKFIEQALRVRILFACLVGSHAWGFASEQSDWDSFFLFVRPTADYLRLDPLPDVHEFAHVEGQDSRGWDIFKALRLLRGSNPSLIEYLHAPVVYREDPSVLAPLRTLAQTYYSPASLHFHYLRIAQRHYHQYLANRSEVNLKKSLYTLRPLIILLYLAQHTSLPPINFLDMLAQVDLASEVRQAIASLIDQKCAGSTLTTQLNPVLTAFITQRLTLEAEQTPFHPQTEERTRELSEALNHLLVSLLIPPR